jgi:CspA family cold shock protein
MAYQDTQAICTKCGKEFIFRIEEQRRQAERGEEITPPALCPSCQGRAHQKPRTQPRREVRSRTQREPKPKSSAELGAGPHEGTVKWYDSERGYGFIVQPVGDDIFFHRTGIAPGETPSFPDGTRVTYLVEETSKGPQAVDVAKMDAGDSA